MSETCRLCGEAHLEHVLDLGEVPLANALLASADEPFKRFPLGLSVCDDCGLAQLTHEVRGTELFQKDYPYFSGTSRHFREHFRWIARKNFLNLLVDDDTVCDVGCNDGTLLDYYRERGCRTAGFEPSSIHAEIASGKGHDVRNTFLSTASAGDYADAYRLIHCHNVLAHVDDLLDFLRAVKTLLAPGGTFVVEAPYARHLVDGLQFDQIYHEHKCYFTLKTLSFALESCGLFSYNVFRTPVHGGSLLLLARQEPADGGSPALDYLDGQEKLDLVNYPVFYQGLRPRLDVLERSLRNLLAKHQSEGRRVIGFGAPAKATTLLNVLGVSDQLDSIVDHTPAKQGKFVPGTGLEIRDPKMLDARAGGVDFLVLAWNWFDEILHRSEDLRTVGARFINPLPFPRVV